ncbi:MAG: glycosyltransferase family 4 protein [Nanoarchaeota archaeon]|nr:glycosyltransferase family 4 protein [Nanoarchaeota archaeon]
MDKKPTISLVYEFLSEQGGLEREIINHANFLKQEGYNVLILTCHKGKDIEMLLPFDGLKIVEISSIKTRFQFLNLALCFLGFNNLKKHNPSLFLSYSAPSNFLIKNKKTKKLNYVNHYPHFLYLEKNKKLEWANTFDRKISLFLSLFFKRKLINLDRRLLRENKLIFTNSNFTKKTIDFMYKVDSIVSYPPIDSKIKSLKNKVVPKPFIFTCGRIIPDKKYGWLIKSCALMKNKIPVYIAGQGNKKYIQTLINLSKKLNVKLFFLGKLNTPELTKYYSSAEVFVFSAPKEDFGLVPAESLACGTPCVVWGDNAGPTEQIIEGINGFHAKPYDLHDFAKKIDKLININFKKNNREKIINSASKFSAKEIKELFINEINKVLKD